MKVAFPVQDDRGLDSGVYGHFGSARFFLIVEIVMGINKDWDLFFLINKGQLINAS